jgi:DNA-binding transcriptional ArsR family regulator
MSEGPSIVGVAALIGDHARAEILTALMAGRALTATELAHVAGITKQTASAHLSKLRNARLIAMESQGRHRYFRVASQDVARLLEGLMGLAFHVGTVRARLGPREPALRKSRVCYDHLAGELGVLVYDGLLRQRALELGENAIELTERGAQLFTDLGVDIDALTQRRRVLCRACLDWSERRHHLAGALGSAMFDRFLHLGWARRTRDSRVVIFTAGGESSLRKLFVGASARVPKTDSIPLAAVS